MDMLNSLTAFAALLICAYAQRPFYSNGVQYPSVLPQNLPNNTDLGNRLGENSTTDPYKVFEKDPLYNVEKELVDRIKNEYPRDKQPFWYVNAAHLNNFKNPQKQIQTQEYRMTETPRPQQENVPRQQRQRS